MKRKILFSAAAIAGFGLACAAAAKSLPTSATSPAFSGHQYASIARVALARARTIALKARPGVITDQELEKEGGGTGLRYSFDVKAQSGVTYEVGVDARTGKVLENAKEGSHPD